MITVIRNAKCATLIDGVKFYPGTNLLSQVEFEKIKEHKQFKEEVGLQMMRVSSEIASETSKAVEKTNLKDRAAEMAKEIQSLSASEAKTVLNKLNDANIIKKVIELDGRKGVQEAAEERLKSIHNQEDAEDLSPESKVAPEGDGSDFLGEIGDSKEAQSGLETKTAIPALKKKKRKK